MSEPYPRQILTPEAVQKRLGFPREEVVRAIEVNSREAHAWLTTRSPTAAAYRHDTFCAGSTGLPSQILNFALGGHLAPDEIDPTIEAVKAFYAARGAPWMWWLGEDYSPADLGAHLERHGLPWVEDLPALACRLPAKAVHGIPEIGLTRPARTAADLEAAGLIRQRAFRMREEVRTYFSATADDWLRGDPARVFLAEVDGAAAALGILVVVEEVAGVYVMATLPAYRRRLGWAILARLLTTAADEGYDLAILTASRFGYPLYRAAGFEHLFDYRIYCPPEYA